MIADRYRLERKVGGGRVSAVWRVHDQIGDATCAVKLLHRSMHKHSEALTRFSLEDRLARELSGPHFAERIGSGSWEGLRYIAWRWHEGESLRALFDRNPKQDAPTVHSIVQETCQALTGVHAAGYTHGDIKPENLYFADRGESDTSRQLKLISFGVASRIVPFSAAANGRRRAGQLVGTPLYMSPDLILGRTPRGGQADLWALAVLVYEALTGRAPFLGRDLGEVLEAILKRDAPRPSTVADTLPGTIDLWWAQALEQEFNTPSEFASSLTRALGPALRSSHTQRSASLPERTPVVGEGASAAFSTAVGLGSVPPAASGPLESPALAAAATAAAASSTAAGTSAAALPSARPPAASGAGSASATASSTSLSGTLAGTGPKSPLASTAARASAVASSFPATGANPVSATASGIGPAVRPSASRSVEGPTPEAPPAASANGAATSDDDRFAPLPSPLRDLSATASRKTLVGITPPMRPSAPPPSASSLATTSDASAARRSVEISAVVPVHDPPAHGSDSMRRPANPTVPFPRPRLLPRLSPAEGDATPMRGVGSGHTWRGQTTRTLNFVWANRDHKSQRIAAVLVCAAAAFVIFVVGRSPVSGTATIGQAKSALNPEGTPAPISGEPAAPPRAAPQDARPSGETEAPAMTTSRDVAGDLAVPASEAQTVGGSSESPRAPAGRAGGQGLSEPPRPIQASPPTSAPKSPAPPAEPAQKSRTELKAPVKRNSEPTPPGGKGGEFDFGI